jgi:hypothetical protein
MGATEPLEPEVVAALEAIDATLQGEPVDPELAELAELALILRDDRPVADPAFLARLDRRVQRRFTKPSRPSRAWAARWRVSLAAVTAVVAVSVAGIVVAVRSHEPRVTNGSGVVSATSGSHAAASSSAASNGGTSTTGASGAGGAASPTTATAPQTMAKAPGRAPAPPIRRGRDLTQSARLRLLAAPGRIAPVAREVFDVIGAEHGDVLSSHVTQTTGAPGFATFSLQVPAPRLEATLDRLSSLDHARVMTREDASADITTHVDNTAAALAAAQARRRSLLRQLAATDIAAQADRLQREAARVLVQIDRDQSALDTLHHRVAESTITVTVQSSLVAHHPGRSRGFTFGRALHDAGHILLVAAGVALIALAVLVPLGLVVAVCAWMWSLVLRRRREGALGPS